MEMHLVEESSTHQTPRSLASHHLSTTVESHPSSDSQPISNTSINLYNYCGKKERCSTRNTVQNHDEIHSSFPCIGRFSDSVCASAIWGERNTDVSFIDARRIEHDHVGPRLFRILPCPDLPPSFLSPFHSYAEYALPNTCRTRRHDGPRPSVPASLALPTLTAHPSFIPFNPSKSHPSTRYPTNLLPPCPNLRLLLLHKDKPY
jgi:hypothetical protein